MERHVSHSALARVFSGQAPAPEAEGIIPHLAGCRRCWDAAARVIAGLRSEGRLAPPAEACKAVLVLLETEEAKALGRLLARARWTELRRLPASQQLKRIKADLGLRTLDMFSVLAGAAAATSQEDPYQGEETALVAHSLAGALPGSSFPEPFRNDMQSEALMIAANCRRLAGDWRGSAAALGMARKHLQQGTGEPAREARLLSIQASLATDTGHLEQALDLLTRASSIYDEAGDARAVVSVTIQEANTLLAASQHAVAIARAEEALRSLAPGQARLEMLARNIITESLVFLGRPTEALQSLSATQPLFKRFWGRRTELRLSYLEALLLAALGHARESEKTFGSLIAGFLDAELYKDAFLMMLTHFEILFRRGALDKAARACEEALEKIEQAGTGCHSQMTELWRDLLTLVNARRLTEHQLLAARQYLVRHWTAPARHPPLEGAVRFSGVSLSRSLAPEPQGMQLSAGPAPVVTDLGQGGYEEALERYARELIAAGLARCGGRVRETSRLLGISRNTLRDKIRKYGLVAGEPEPAPAKPDVPGEEEILARLRARAWWAELKTLSPGGRLEKAKAVSSLQTREMFDTMIEEASAVALNDPHKAEETAFLAHTLAGLLPRSRCPEPLKNDLQGMALLVVANCRRLAGDWKGSSAALQVARSHLARGSGEPAREARLLSIEASLASDTGHAEQALALLARAAALYRRVQDSAAVASATIQEANTLLAASRHEEAILRAEEALRLLPAGEARLELLARNIITECLAFLGRPAEALRSFIATAPLYEQHRERRTELRLGYLEAILLDSLGHSQESEKIFQSLMADFMEDGLYKDAFLTMLTHFVSLVQRGDLARAARACEEAVERIEEAGEEGHAPMKELWRGLLTLVNARLLTESHLLEARHYLARCGNAPAQAAQAPPPLPRWVTGREEEAPEAAAPPDPSEEEPAALTPRSPGGEPVPPAPPDPAASLAKDGYKRALERYDRQLVASALAESKGQIDDACRLLGLSRLQLRRKLRRYFLSANGEEVQGREKARPQAR